MNKEYFFRHEPEAVETREEIRKRVVNAHHLVARVGSRSMVVVSGLQLSLLLQTIAMPVVVLTRSSFCH